jgi:small subunit ribosomal protein S14
MKKYIRKDNLTRKKVVKNENRRISLKIIQNHLGFDRKKRFNTLVQLSKMKRSSSLTRVTNRCVKTGRSKSVYRFFKLSRIMVKDLASKGLLPSVQKDIW